MSLAFEQAAAAERAMLRPDRGTTLRHPTLRKGTVTTASTTSITCQVDGLPAANVTGWKLAVGEVVWLLADQGRRLVVGVTTIKEA